MHNDTYPPTRTLVRPPDGLQARTGQAYALIREAQLAAADNRRADAANHLVDALVLSEGDAACRRLLEDAAADLAGDQPLNLVERLAQLNQAFRLRRLALFNPDGAIL